MLTRNEEACLKTALAVVVVHQRLRRRRQQPPPSQHGKQHNQEGGAEANKRKVSDAATTDSTATDPHAIPPPGGCSLVTWSNLTTAATEATEAAAAAAAATTTTTAAAGSSGREDSSRRWASHCTSLLSLVATATTTSTPTNTSTKTQQALATYLAHQWCHWHSHDPIAAWQWIDEQWSTAAVTATAAASDHDHHEEYNGHRCDSTSVTNPAVQGAAPVVATTTATRSSPSTPLTPTTTTTTVSYYHTVWIIMIQQSRMFVQRILPRMVQYLVRGYQELERASSLPLSYPSPLVTCGSKTMSTSSSVSASSSALPPIATTQSTTTATHTTTRLPLLWELLEYALVYHDTLLLEPSLQPSPVIAAAAATIATTTITTIPPNQHHFPNHNINDHDTYYNHNSKGIVLAQELLQIICTHMPSLLEDLMSQSHPENALTTTTTSTTTTQGSHGSFLLSHTSTPGSNKDHYNHGRIIMETVVDDDNDRIRHQHHHHDNNHLYYHDLVSHHGQPQDPSQHPIKVSPPTIQWGNITHFDHDGGDDDDEDYDDHMHHRRRRPFLPNDPPTMVEGHKDYHSHDNNHRHDPKNPPSIRVLCRHAYDVSSGTTLLHRYALLDLMQRLLQIHPPFPTPSDEPLEKTTIHSTV